MRIRFRRPRFAIALLTALAALPSMASADDVVVMPYRCAVVDGKPVLTPSEEQGHRVLGAKEQRKVKTCSTVDRNHCRQWTTFKFDMDCGGTRVSWMQVFANASEFTRRRVWEQNGSLRVRNTPQRSKRIDDMCARRMGVNQEWWSVNEICDEVSPVNPPTATDMPAGFAPMVGLDAVFLPGEAIGLPPARPIKTAAAAPAPKVPVADAPKAKVEAVKTEPVKAARRETEVPVAVKTVTAESGATSASNSAPVPRAAPTPIETPSQAPPQAAASDAAPAAQATTQPVDVRQPAPASMETVPPETTHSTPAAREATDVQPATASERIDGPQPVAVQTAAAEPAAITDAKLETGSELPDGHNQAYIIVALASALLVVTLLLVRWLGHAKSGEAQLAQSRREPPVFADAAGVVAPVVDAPIAARPRPVANHDQGRERPPLALGTAVAVAPQHHVSRSEPRGHPVQRSGMLSIGDRMPSSRHEALELLGMGIASDGNIGSVKKIIDGLRMNWHPDHARDDADRRLREVRLKQINAAWDILGDRAQASPGA